MCQPARENFGNRTRCKVELQIFRDPVSLPAGEDVALWRGPELADSRGVNVDGFGQMTDERSKERLASAGRSSLHDGSKRLQIVAHGRNSARRAVVRAVN